MYIIVCETDRQSRLDAWGRVLRAGALGRPWGVGWGGSGEGGSGWGTHVHPWQIHVNVWQKPLQYCKVISLQLKLKKKKKEIDTVSSFFRKTVFLFLYVGTYLVAQMVKNPPAMRETCIKPGFDPWVEKIPGGGHDNPLQYSCLENPHGQRSLVGYSPWIHKELDPTGWLSTQHTSLADVVMGNICLEQNQTESWQPFTQIYSGH